MYDGCSKADIAMRIAIERAWDFPAVQRQRAERQLLSGADIRSLPERHCIATEDRPVVDWQLVGAQAQKQTLVQQAKDARAEFTGEHHLGQAVVGIMRSDGINWQPRRGRGGPTIA